MELKVVDVVKLARSFLEKTANQPFNRVEAVSFNPDKEKWLVDASIGIAWAPVRLTIDDKEATVEDMIKDGEPLCPHPPNRQLKNVNSSL